MKNVTITVEETVARWARIRAAERNTSVSRMVGEMLADAMRRETRYQSAMRRYLARGPVALSEPGTPYPTRDEVHERSRLR
jgi:hypothetical protein